MPDIRKWSGILAFMERVGKQPNGAVVPRVNLRDMAEPCVYDLHAHTFYSDGALSPAELVARAAANGVQVLALTDHDVTDGVPEAQAAAQQAGITLVPGVEISVTWPGNRSCVSGTSAIHGGRGGQTVHVIGLQVDVIHPGLQAGLARLREFRDWRAEEIGRRLAKAGIPGAIDDARRRAQRGLVSRTHFAQFLVAAGHATDVRSVFKKYLVHGKPGHVPGAWAGLDEAIGWIRAAGGQAVLAHPARYKITATRLRKLLGEFRDAGGAAIEVVSGSHSRDDIFRFAQLANSYGLLASSGSDFHAPQNFYADLGRLPRLPDGCTPVWQAWGAPVPAAVV
jgi:predicted metal-dependent phosphoesterase TrpH